MDCKLSGFFVEPDWLSVLLRPVIFRVKNTVFLQMTKQLFLPQFALLTHFLWLNFIITIALIGLFLFITVTLCRYLRASLCNTYVALSFSCYLRFEQPFSRHFAAKSCQRLLHSAAIITKTISSIKNNDKNGITFINLQLVVEIWLLGQKSETDLQQFGSE